jgi:hypothetical protein
MNQLTSTTGLFRAFYTFPRPRDGAREGPQSRSSNKLAEIKTESSLEDAEDMSRNAGQAYMNDLPRF